MKKFLTILLVATAFFSISGFSQSAKKGGGMQMKQRLMDSLKISDVKADSVIAIRQQMMPQMKGVMKDSSLSQDARKEKVKAMKEEMKKRLQNILTEDQIMKLQQMEMDMRKKNDQ